MSDMRAVRTAKVRNRILCDFIKIHPIFSFSLLLPNRRLLFGTIGTCRRDQVNRKVSELDSELTSIIKIQSSLNMNSLGDELLREKLDQLGTRKLELVIERELVRTEIESSEDAKEIRVVVEDNAVLFKRGWKKATPVLRKRLLHRVINAIHVTPDCLKVLYVTERSEASLIHSPKTKMPQEQNSGGAHYELNLPSRKNRKPSGRYSVARLSSLGIGGRDWSVDAHSEVVDFIRLSNPPIVSRAPEMAALYESGHSISQIARKFGKAKSTIKNSLEVHGVVLRPAIGSKIYLRQGQNKRTSSNPPFGFLLLRNEFTPHPKEIETLREIITLSEQGRGPLQIAKRLNELALPTRSKKPWAHSVVAGIIKRFKANGYPYNELKR